MDNKNNIEPLTVGKIREAMKDCPDDMPVYIETEDDYLYCLFAENKYIGFYDDNCENESSIDAFVLGFT